MLPPRTHPASVRPAMADAVANPIARPACWTPRAGTSREKRCAIKPICAKRPKFIALAAAMALGLFAQIGLIAHLFSLLVPALGVQQAGLAMGLATASAIAGRTLAGWVLGGSIDRRLVACASYAVQIAGCIVFVVAAGSSPALLLLAVVLFGAGIGNATSLPPLIAQTEL